MKYKLLIYILLVFCFANLTWAAALQKKSTLKILIFHSYPAQERTYQINKGLEETLKQFNAAAEVRSVSMNYNSLEKLFAVYRNENWAKSSSEIIKEQKRLLRELKDYSPDIVVVCDDEVAHAIATEVNRLNIPIFFLGINEVVTKASWYQKSNKKMITGLIESYPVSETIAMFRNIIRVNRVALLSGAGFSSHHITKQFKKELKKANIEISKIYNLSKWKEWKSAVKEINETSDLVWILVPYHVFDSKGAELGISKIGGWLYDNLLIPSTGITDIHVKAGVFAAISPSSFNLGRQTAEQIIRYLNGMPLENIEITNNRYHDFDININTAEKLKIPIPNEFILLTNARKFEKIREKEGTIK